MSTDKILCVDDDPNLLEAFQRFLRKKFVLETALGPEAGLAKIASEGPFAVVVSDMQMPGMNGVEFLARVRQLTPLSVRIMLTGNADQKTAMDAVNQGAIFRFLNKPCLPEDMARTLEAAIFQYRLVTAEKELLERTLNGSIQVLTEILTMADPRSFGRSEAVRDRAVIISSLVGVEDAWAVESAALLSGIGNATIPPEVLVRHRVHAFLSPEEKDMVGRASEAGAKLLARIPRLERVAEYIRLQRHDFDRPAEPAAEELPLGARILRIACDLADLEQRGSSVMEALEEMGRRKGAYDPVILDKLLLLYRPQGSVPARKPGTAEVRVADLSIGQTLAADVLHQDGRLLIAAGHVVTETLLARLRNFAKVNGLREPIVVEKRPV